MRAYHLPNKDRPKSLFFFFVRIADVFCLTRTMNKRTRAKETKNKYAELHRLIRPHVDSFNYFLDEGLQQAVADLDPVEVTSSDGKSLTCILLMTVLKHSNLTIIYFFLIFFDDQIQFGSRSALLVCRRRRLWTKNYTLTRYALNYIKLLFWIWIAIRSHVWIRSP
jgi:hypothetical protein